MRKIGQKLTNEREFFFLIIKNFINKRFEVTQILINAVSRSNHPAVFAEVFNPEVLYEWKNFYVIKLFKENKIKSKRHDF